jgi:hypothetical protein
VIKQSKAFEELSTNEQNSLLWASICFCFYKQTNNRLNLDKIFNSSFLARINEQNQNLEKSDISIDINDANLLELMGNQLAIVNNIALGGQHDFTQELIKQFTPKEEYDDNDDDGDAYDAVYDDLYDV